MEQNVSASPAGASPAPSRPRELWVELSLPVVLSVGSARWRVLGVRLYSDPRVNRFRASASITAVPAGGRDVELTAEDRTMLGALLQLAGQLQSSALLEPVS